MTARLPMLFLVAALSAGGAASAAGLVDAYAAVYATETGCANLGLDIASRQHVQVSREEHAGSRRESQQDQSGSG